MKDANTATYDVRDPDTGIAGISRQAGFGSPKHTARRAHFPIDTSRSAGNQPFADSAAAWQVREDKEYYIPDFLSEEHFESHPDVRDAASEHARDLHQAERYLDEAFNLVRVLRASSEDEGDSRAMQADTVLAVIEKKLNKAHTRLDKHDRRHTKLFLAYFELKGESDKGTD